LLLVIALAIAILATLTTSQLQQGKTTSTTKEEFVAKIDKYLDQEGLFGSHAIHLEAEELFRGALKRIRERLVSPPPLPLPHPLPTDFVPPIYNQTVIDAFASKTLLNPPVNLTYNPYSIAGFNTTQNDSVCAVYYPDESDRSTYYLVNFTSAAEAEANGAFVTHLHTCGLCSTTKDLSSYMQYMDLTSPIRDCAIVTFVSNEESLECMMHSVGFTYDCAVIWLYDALNTRADCKDICIYDYIMHTPNNLPPNSTNLNPCLQCDEDKSGPVFKAVAGRTRRDSGLRSAINRPPSSIYNITHYYY
ncbi:hypothetical protein SAMD00019534_004750, partial [Acytostelium subglobosum LB1]|uniref:hypothetical protein n=1 Tax=Acytostelium subglobosum LB1 TaxID=1410327 RepID=UPI000644C5AF